MPYRAIKHNIADSLNVVVQIERRPGARFVSEVLEIHDYEPTGDCYHLESIYSRHEERLERCRSEVLVTQYLGYPPSGLLAPRGIVEPEILMCELRSDG